MQAIPPTPPTQATTNLHTALAAATEALALAHRIQEQLWRRPHSPIASY